MAKRKAPAGGSRLEAKVAADLAALGLMDDCVRQYKFHSQRKWLIDFFWDTCEAGYWINKPVALEVNGGTYLQGARRGAHSRGSRQRKDYEKWGEISMMGITLLLVDSVDVRKGVHVERVLRALGRA